MLLALGLLCVLVLEFRGEDVDGGDGADDVGYYAYDAHHAFD